MSNELFEKARAFLHGPFDPELGQEIFRASLFLTPEDRKVLKDLLDSYVWDLLTAATLASNLQDSLWGQVSKCALAEARKTGGTDALRTVACGLPQTALDYAEYVDKGPHPETRTAACREGRCAYEYARDVDKGPCAETRTGACLDEDSAFRYAQKVDRVPCDETRAAAFIRSEVSPSAQFYAQWEEEYHTIQEGIVDGPE